MIITLIRKTSPHSFCNTSFKNVLIRNTQGMQPVGVKVGKAEVHLWTGEVVKSCPFLTESYCELLSLGKGLIQHLPVRIFP